MQVTFYLLMTVISTYQAQAYRYTIFLDDPVLCNELTCDDGSKHTTCKELTPSKLCSDFKRLEVTATVRSMMVLGHNGIRSKIAEDWNIANMNLLHWSKDLQMMSDHFIMDCVARRDSCDFLVRKEITVGHNFYFSKDPPSERWAGRAIRKWYFELGYKIKSWDQFYDAKRKNHTFPEFTQLIWPTTEFVGCSGAKIFNGYIATCYYHPAKTGDLNEFVRGKGCSKCPEDRPTCSRDFTNLCGVDISEDSAVQLSTPSRNLIVCALLALIFIFKHSTVTV